MDIVKITEALEGRRHKLRLYYLLSIVGYIVAVIFFFIDKRIMAGIVLACAAGHLLVVRPVMKKLRFDLSYANVTAGLGPMLEYFTHEPKRGMDPQVIRLGNLVPMTLDKGFISREYISGRSGAYVVEAADVASNYVRYLDKKRDFVWVTGAWTHVTLPSDTGCNFRIMSKHLMREDFCRQYYEKKLNFRPVQTGNAFLDEHFYVCFDGRTEIPSHLLRLVQDLQEYTPGNVGVSLVGSELHVLVTSRFIPFNRFVLSEAVTRQAVETVSFPELRLILDMARACTSKE